MKYKQKKKKQKETPTVGLEWGSCLYLSYS